MSSIKWVLFTKRTNYPKLGHIIAKCRAAGIPTKIVRRSWHAPILEVPVSKEKSAWKILTHTLDNMDDDDYRFMPSMDVMPDILDENAL